MRFRYAAATAAALALVVSAASAQDKPSFAGKWAPDAEKNAAAGGGGGGGGRGGMAGPMTIAIDGSTLTITRDTPNGAMTQTYKLDGSEQAVSMGQMEGKASAKWDGPKIVIATVIQTPNGERRTVQEYSMEGESLVVSSTQPPRGGGDPVTTKRYFKKG